MQLTTDSIVWDVGAGSGSVAIEAAQIASSGMVYGIEMDAEDYSLWVENAKRFGVSNLKPILGEAPGLGKPPRSRLGLRGWYGSCRLRIGHGSLGKLRQGGCLIASVASIENAGGSSNTTS